MGKTIWRALNGVVEFTEWAQKLRPGRGGGPAFIILMMGIWATIDPILIAAIGAEEVASGFFNAFKLEHYPGCVQFPNGEHGACYQSAQQHYDSQLRTSFSVLHVRFFCAVLFFLTLIPKLPRRWFGLGPLLTLLIGLYYIVGQEFVFWANEHLGASHFQQPFCLSRADHAPLRDIDILSFVAERFLHNIAFGDPLNLVPNFSGVSYQRGILRYDLNMWMFDILVPTLVGGIPALRAIVGDTSKTTATDASRDILSRSR